VVLARGMSQSVQLPPTPGSPASVLTAARKCQGAVRAGEAGLFALAVEWAGMHEPYDDRVEAAHWFRGEAVPLAGAGAPLVTEDAVAEFAAAVGMSTDQGRSFIGNALEVCHRLPDLWEQVMSGAVPVWRARKVADQTFCLPAQGAAFVDRHVAPVAGKISFPLLQRVVTEAMRRHAPELLPASGDRGPDRRHVTIFDHQVSFNGTVHLDADVDLGDALDLQQALQATAAQLKLAGSTDTLDGRRATALGEIARTQLALTFPDTPTVAEATEEPSRNRAPAKRPVTLYLHLAEDALTGDPTSVGRCDNTRTPVNPEAIRAWCRTGEVTITPVIDINAHLRTDQYEVRGRLRTQVDLRDGGCVFPWCTRRARTCDHDHVIPHDRGGPTCSCNIVPLCRHHHRLKTHYRWRSVMPEPGVYLWTSPHGYVFLRDHTGTVDVTPAGHVPIPGCPDPTDGTDPPPD
jgi:hypothetical protein